MGLFDRRVERTDVDDLIPGGVGDASPHEAHQPKHDQNDAKCLVDNTLLRRPPETMQIPPAATALPGFVKDPSTGPIRRFRSLNTFSRTPLPMVGMPGAKTKS